MIGTTTRTSAPHPRAAVDHRRLLDLDGEIAQEADEEPHRERDVEHGVDDDQRQVGVGDPEHLVDEVDGNDERDGREHPQHEQEDRQDAAAEAPAGDRVGRRQADDQRGDHAHGRDDQAVHEVARPARPREQRDVVLERRLRGDPHRREREEVLVALERRGHDPEEGTQEEHERREEPEVGQDVADAPPHAMALGPPGADGAPLERDRHQRRPRFPDPLDPHEDQGQDQHAADDHVGERGGVAHAEVLEAHQVRRERDRLGGAAGPAEGQHEDQPEQLGQVDEPDHDADRHRELEQRQA